MIVFPPCKINLGLYVTAKREDGFHAISSVFYPIPLCDALEIIQVSGEDGTSIFSSSGLEIPGNMDSNLVVKAYKLLDALYGLPAVKIHLHKVIPMGAGLGGGSSDGAWALRLLNELFALQIPQVELMNLAANLGSDCPFFILDEPCAVSGRGEVLSPFSLPLDGYSICLVNPGIHISTAQAFQSVKIEAAPEKWMEQLHLPPENWTFHNAFEVGMESKHPEINQIKQKLIQEGALYTSMTGTGSTVFGIFKQAPQIEGKFPGYFSKVIESL
jgi:4-diphosphocytidyl-2-C-methyl-D-erythritol kinase